jgi:beta-galactosidase
MMLIRSKKSDFDSGWRFNQGDVVGADGPGFDDSEWDPVTLPHSFNARDTFVQKRGYYRGSAWYRKKFSIPRRGRRTFVRFDAAWGKVQLYVNGADLGSHNGGLAGFEVEITDSMISGENVIAVRVDNSHDPSVLPGKFIPDYNIYGGLCGHVYLVVKPPVFLPWRSTVITTPEVGDDRAIVDVVAHVVGHEKWDVKAIARIWDPEGEVAQTGEVLPGLTDVFSFHVEIPTPRLWSPKNPHLYEIEIELVVGGKVVDTVRDRFGIRQFEFDENRGFLLNGYRLQLRGVNRHQDFPGLGNALPRSLNRLDASLIRDIGANFVRTSHYPQSPDFLDACDELGILVYEEITSWQFIGGEDFISAADVQMSAMVRRDRNRPSIILWGMMNEGRSKKMFERLKQTSLEHDPTRPTIYADNKLGDGVFQETIYIPHVLGVNYKLESIDAFHSAYPSLKLLVSEHTNADNAVRGEKEVERVQSERIASDLDFIESREFISGSTLWSMHDYGTDYEPVWPIQRSGILDIYRNPKEAYHMLKSRWTAEPFVHLASDWHHGHSPGDQIDVRVYTNCSEVELVLNGESLGSKSGSDPLEWKVEFVPGELRALGKSGKSVGASDCIASPGEPVSVELSRSDDLTADGRDVSILAARVVDEDGNLVSSYKDPIAFEVEGPGELVGIGGSPSSQPLEGIANMLVKSKTESGQIRVSAVGSGLRPGQMQFGSKAAQMNPSSGIHRPLRTNF